LPDSAFVWIEPGGKKDEEGKTVPRGLRHLPIRDHTGKLDRAHVIAAYQAVRGARTGKPMKIPPKAWKKLRAAMKELGIGEFKKVELDFVAKEGYIPAYLEDEFNEKANELRVLKQYADVLPDDAREVIGKMENRLAQYVLTEDAVNERLAEIEEVEKFMMEGDGDMEKQEGNEKQGVEQASTENQNQEGKTESLSREEIEQLVKETVQGAVKEAVAGAVKEALANAQNQPEDDNEKKDEGKDDNQAGDDDEYIEVDADEIAQATAQVAQSKE